MYVFALLIFSIFIVNAAEIPEPTKKLQRTKSFDDLTEFWPHLKKPRHVSPQATPNLSQQDIFEEHVNYKEIPYQGWKIYISASVENMALVKDKIVPSLDKAKTNYKIIKSYEAYLHLNSHDKEAGKYITIYPRNYNEAVTISQDLNILLCSLSTNTFMNIPYCLRLGQSGGLWTRYGRFKYSHFMKDSQVLVVPKEDQFLSCPTPQDLRQKIIDNKRVFQLDDRTQAFPDFVGTDWLPFDEAPKLFAKNDFTSKIFQDDYGFIDRHLVS